MFTFSGSLIAQSIALAVNAISIKDVFWVDIRVVQALVCNKYVISSEKPVH